MTEKLSKLHHDGLITDEEYDRLKKALNSLRVDEMYELEYEDADSFIPLSVIQEIREEIKHHHDMYPDDGLHNALIIMDKHLKEYTE